jgi:hypothetical protein
VTAAQIKTRFQPLMPEGIRFSAAHPMQPWQGPDGNWHDPGDDIVLIRISNATHFADALIQVDDLKWSDERFVARILRPMFALLKDQTEQRPRVEQAFKEAGLQ